MWPFRRRRARGGAEANALARLQREATAGLVTAGLSHELKNSLTVVLGFAELARTAAERTGADARVLSHLRELENEARRSVAGLEDFLAYAGGAPRPRTACDPDALADEALRLVRPMARMKELLVDQERGGAPPVVCDAHAVGQVLLNLLLNALRFARSRIVVRTTGADGFAELRVSDDGPGVPAADRDRIFRGFTTGGTGFGLRTSRAIAESEGGTLTLEPPSTFLLRLPSEFRGHKP